MEIFTALSDSKYFPFLTDSKKRRVFQVNTYIFAVFFLISRETFQPMSAIGKGTEKGRQRKREGVEIFQLLSEVWQNFVDENLEAYNKM